MHPEPSIARTGLAFANAIVSGEFAAAHAMLTDALRREMSGDDLRANYEQMLSYTKSPPDTIKLGQVLEPPADVPGALGWAFVDIDGLHGVDACWLECVGVLVVNEGARQAIADIIWGRP